jgi:hypothetical protein
MGKFILVSICLIFAYIFYDMSNYATHFIGYSISYGMTALMLGMAWIFKDDI